MKKQPIIKLGALLLVCFAMLGCGKEDNSTNSSNSTVKYGTLCGTVTDCSSGEPIDSVNVRLNPSGDTTLTGMDGTFQFNDVTDGNYSLAFSKSKYMILADDYVIKIKNGNEVCRDVQLSLAFKSFMITVDGVETDTLDFGTNVDSMIFTITNTSSTNIRIKFVESSEWMKLEFLITGFHNYGDDYVYLKPSEGNKAKVIIDRSLLQSGENIGYLYMSSGMLSKTLVINAKGV